MVILMLRTRIPISVWEQEGEAVINTAFRLLFQEDHDLPGLDLDNPMLMHDLGLL